MATSGAPTVDALLATLKQKLEGAKADTFERLAADLFCRLLGDIGVSVSTSRALNSAAMPALRAWGVVICDWSASGTKSPRLLRRARWAVRCSKLS